MVIAIHVRLIDESDYLQAIASMVNCFGCAWTMLSQANIPGSLGMLNGQSPQPLLRHSVGAE